MQLTPFNLMAKYAILSPILSLLLLFHYISYLPVPAAFLGMALCMGLKNLVDHSARRPLAVAAEVSKNIKKERFPRAEVALSEKWVRKILGSMEISPSYCANQPYLKKRGGKGSEDGLH